MFTDRLRIDLKKANLLSKSDYMILEQVRSELQLLGKVLAGHFHGSSVLLTGSLFAGEGRILKRRNKMYLDSDYDIFIITPSLKDANPRLAKPKLDSLLACRPFFAAALEIGLIWKPLLFFNLTTVGGAVFAGSDQIGGLLKKLHSPSGDNSLMQGYKCLTAAPIYQERYSDLCAGALLRAARGLLLAEKTGQPRREWIAYSSAEIVAAKISDWAPVLGHNVIDLICQAINYLLRRDGNGPEIGQHVRYVQAVNSIANNFPLNGSNSFTARQINKMLYANRINTFDRYVKELLLKGFKALADSWFNQGVDAERLTHAVQIAEKLGFYSRSKKVEANQFEEYRSLQVSYSNIISSKPHRFIYTNRERIG